MTGMPGGASWQSLPTIPQIQDHDPATIPQKKGDEGELEDEQPLFVRDSTLPFDYWQVSTLQLD